MSSTADFYKGMFILFKDAPHQIVEFQHVNPGKGSAFVRTRVKNLKTGRVQEFTYKSGENVDELAINTVEMQYLYKEVDTYHFMNSRTYDQSTVSVHVLGDYAKLLKENEIYQILMMEDTAVGVRFPKKVRLKVIETDSAVKGNTVSGATKEAQLETGIVIQVPLFIKNGDTVGIDTDTSSYVERVSS